MSSNHVNDDLAEVDSLARDSDSSAFARLMDLRIVTADRGYALAEVKISPEKHLNFRGGTHGAVIFALADHACGLCGNSLGRKAVLIQASINFFANPEPGSIVRAEARMMHVGKAAGSMIIELQTGTGGPVATCQATILFLD